MEYVMGRRRSRFLGSRIMGAALAFLLFSMCTTFRPSGGSDVGTAAPAANAAVSSERSPNGSGAPSTVSVPFVASFPTVATPPASGGSLPRLPSAVDLPTPALPVAAVVPPIPQPQGAIPLLAAAVPRVNLVGGGEAIASAAGPPGGQSSSEVVPRPLSPASPAATGGLAPAASVDTQPNGKDLPAAAFQAPASGAAPAGAPEAAPARAASPQARSSAQAAGARTTSSPPGTHEAGGGAARTDAASHTRGAAAAGTAAPAAVSSPAAAPPAASAAGPPPAPVQAPAPVPSGTGKAAAGPTAAHAVARNVYARIGDDITIALEGGGWTFTGGGSSGKQWKHGISYESRTVDATGMSFTFKATALGKWILNFQQQEASTGASRHERVDVEVLTEQEFARALAAKRSAGSAGTEGGAAVSSLVAADWLYKEGKYNEALDAYEKAWNPGEPALTDKIAELAYRVGRYGDARKYWQKNFDLRGTSYGDLAVAGLMKTATVEKDTPELRALFDSVHALPRMPNPSDLLAAARYLVDAKQWEVAIGYLEEYLRRYNGRPGADVADYLLGQIYEGDTPMQNARKALEYYREIVDRYPTSTFYDRARANIVYLRRQFFEIR